MNTRPVSRRRSGILPSPPCSCRANKSLTSPTQASSLNNMIVNPGFMAQPRSTRTNQTQVNNSLPAPQPTFMGGADLGRDLVPLSSSLPLGHVFILSTGLRSRLRYWRESDWFLFLLV